MLIVCLLGINDVFDRCDCPSPPTQGHVIDKRATVSARGICGMCNSVFVVYWQLLILNTDPFVLLSLWYSLAGGATFISNFGNHMT